MTAVTGVPFDDLSFVGLYEAISLRGASSANDGKRIAHGRLVLDGGSEWVVSGSHVLRQRVQAAVGRYAERIGDRLILSFRNAVGRFRVVGVCDIEVETNKIGTSSFSAMLEHLMVVAAELPFASGAMGSLPFERTSVSHRDLAYHAFVYLRHAVLEPDFASGVQGATDPTLVESLEAIIRDPHHRLDREPVLVDAGMARSVDSRSLLDLVSRPGGLERAPAGLGGALSKIMKGHLPRVVLERQAIRTVDLPENRFVRAFLDQCLDVVAQMRRLIVTEARLSVHSVRLQSECDQIETALRPIRQASLWDDVGMMTYVPAGSTVLQRRWPYRETFRHFTRLMLGSRVPVDQRDVWAILEAKDAANLYELWCYFAVVEAVTDGMGRRPDEASAFIASHLDVGVPWKYDVVWHATQGTPRVNVIYNATFSKAGEYRRSSSVTLRPDVLLEIKPQNAEKPERHAFDAKFRVKLESPPRQGLESAEEGGDDWASARIGRNVLSTYETAHTYRDALENVRSVRILYPGTEASFHPAHGAVNGLRDGVGALPLRPGDAVQMMQLREVLSDLILHD